MPARKSSPTIRAVPREIAIGAPASASTEAIVFLAMSEADPLRVELPGQVSRIGGSYRLDIIPMMALKLSSAKRTKSKFAFVHFAERDRDSTLGALSRLADSVQKRTPVDFALQVDAGEATVGHLLAARRNTKRPGAPDAETAMRISLRVGERKSPLVSDPIPGLVYVNRDAGRQVDSEWLEELEPLEWCPPWDCHAHWVGDPTYPGTWWTECHEASPCPAGKKCLCGRGGIFCQGMK